MGSQGSLVPSTHQAWQREYLHNVSIDFLPYSCRQQKHTKPYTSRYERDEPICQTQHLGCALINRSGEDAQSGFAALFVLAPVETSRARVCRGRKFLASRYAHRTATQASDRVSNRLSIRDESDGRTRTRGVSAGSNKSRWRGGQIELLASWAILLSSLRHKPRLKLTRSWTDRTFVVA